MSQTRVKRCSYKHGQHTSLAQNFTVKGKTEDAVREFLEKRHRGEKIVIQEIVWG